MSLFTLSSNQAAIHIDYPGTTSNEVHIINVTINKTIYLSTCATTNCPTAIPF